jgi:hypothetical protein
MPPPNVPVAHVRHRDFLVMSQLQRWTVLVFLLLIVPTRLWAQGADKPAKAKRITVTGQVADHDDALLEGIAVVLVTPKGKTYSTFTDQSGCFRLKVHTTPGYTVYANRVIENAVLRNAGHEIIETRAGKPSHYLRFAPPVAPAPPVAVVPPVTTNSYEVKGQVLNADGSPAVGARVRVSSGRGRYFKVDTDANGRFSFRSEADEEFYIYPTKVVGDVIITSSTHHVTPAIAAELGVSGFVLRFLPEREDDYSDYVMVGQAMGTVGESDHLFGGSAGTAVQKQAIDPATRKVKVFPDLNMGFMQVSVNDTTPMDFVVRLIGTQGEELSTQDWHAVPGTSLSMAIGRLPTGMYRVELRDAQGNIASQQLEIDRSQRSN